MSRNMFWNFYLLISFKMRIKFDRMCKYCFFYFNIHISKNKMK